MAFENRSPGAEPFAELDELVASLREAAKSLEQQRVSRVENLFHPNRQVRRQADFGRAVVNALKEIADAVRQTRTIQESKLAELERALDQINERLAKSIDERCAGFERELAGLRREQEHVAQQHAQATRNLSGQQEELRQQFEQFAREFREKLDENAGEQKELGTEFRERIQHLLDEQRVAIRQLALKMSEDAVLSDRARRAAELKMEELAKRLPPPRA